MSETETIIEAEGLQTYFEQKRSIKEILMREDTQSVQAVDGVSVELSRNEVIGVIGESGCGKTTLLMTLLGLQDSTGGTLTFNGKSYAEFDRSDWKEFRRNVQIIFQDPFDSLDPQMTVRETLEIPLDVHDIGNKEERILDTLERVELRPPERYIDRYPQQLSGGEKQRVSIARALILDPEVILADEPVSMLDVSTQAVILQLLSDLAEQEEIAMMYISHDLSTVSYVCDRINVMYLGRFIETAPTAELLNNPKHPYSQELIKAIPVANPHRERDRTVLEGSTPEPIDMGEGCRFADRCPEVMDVCEHTPRAVAVSEDDLDGEHEAACHLYYDHQEGDR
jgi:peptide/nickel transport system ATP-binding protein